MFQPDGGTSQSSLTLESKLLQNNTKSDISLLQKVKTAFWNAYNSDAGFIIFTGLGGIAAVVYTYWGTDFAVLSAENRMKEVMVPLVARVAHGIEAWMYGNAALNMLGVMASGEGPRRLGKVIAERDYYKNENQNMRKFLAKQTQDKVSKKELEEHLYEKSAEFVSKELESDSKNGFGTKFKKYLPSIGLATYAVSQAGILATFALVNSGYELDGGLIWNDLLFGAGAGIVMYVAGKYREGKKAMYRTFRQLLKANDNPAANVTAVLRRATV